MGAPDDSTLDGARGVIPDVTPLRPFSPFQWPELNSLSVSCVKSKCCPPSYSTMASGVKVSDDIHTAYTDIKKSKKYRYIIFHIKDDKEICIETKGAREEGYDNYLKHLQAVEDSCRYGLYDFEYEHSCQGTSDTKKQKLFLMSWCPDTAKIKMKMLYSSSFDALKHALEGVGKYIQATDMAEASYECVLEKCRSTDRS